MKIYYSNLASVKFDRGEIPPIGILESYYGMTNVSPPIYCDDYFLDSGAFSAWNQNTTIDLNKFIVFIKKHLDKLTVYASLDNISSAEESMLNYIAMKDEGLDPLPCFHFGEPIKVLFEYASKTNYIALGGIAKRNRKERMIWLDSVFSKFPNEKEIGFHGFGIQDEEIIQSYPWRSVDASSIHMQARYGGIYTPWGWMKINKNVAYQDLKWVTPIQEKKVEEYVLTTGIDYQRACQQSIEGIKARCLISIKYFETLAEKINRNPFMYKSKNKGLGLL